MIKVWLVVLTVSLAGLAGCASDNGSPQGTSAGSGAVRTDTDLSTKDQQ